MWLNTTIKEHDSHGADRADQHDAYLGVGFARS
jgi:hypothetical protein